MRGETPSLPSAATRTEFTGASGIHPLADLLGVRRTVSSDRADVVMEDSPLLQAEADAFLAVGVGVDLCGSGAARTRIGSDARLATTALSVAFARPARPGPLRICATLGFLGQPADGLRPFSTAAQVDDADGRLATASVSGVVIAGAGAPSAAAPRAGVAEDLKPDVMGARALLLAGRRLEPADRGAIDVELGPLITNRVGHLQGGAAPAIADVAARDLLGEAAVLRNVLWAFRGPVQRRPRFELEIARGASSAHAAIRVTEDGRLRGVGVIDYGLRPEGLTKGE